MINLILLPVIWKEIFMFNFLKKHHSFVVSYTDCSFFIRWDVKKVPLKNKVKNCIPYLWWWSWWQSNLRSIRYFTKGKCSCNFFIIGNQICGQEDIILRMKNEGHSLGLHSFLMIEIFYIEVMGISLMKWKMPRWII